VPARRPRRRAFAEQGLRFEIGRHLVRLLEGPEGWLASVDGLPAGGVHSSQAEAWQEGVRAALALQGSARRSRLSGS
jgi:hypothetical protein